MSWRGLDLIVAVTLTVGVGCVVTDAIPRALSASVLSDSTANPRHEAVRTGKWNFTYLFGLSIGGLSGFGATAAAILWWRSLSSVGRSEKSG